jgi:hypothetical protein
MARGRSTPYGAQLRKFLREDDLAVFSAATLEPRFDHPQHQKRGTNIGGIHKALMKAFADGNIITFVDDDGHPLREPEIVVPGSKAIGQPQFFGRPDAESPDPAFHPVSYEEALRRGLTLDNEAGAGANGGVASGASGNGHAGVADPADEPVPDAERSDEEREPEADMMSVDDAIQEIGAYPPVGTTAPDWVDDRVLRAWASLPDVCKHMVRGLDVTTGVDKFELIRAGITRKQRSWRSESSVPSLPTSRERLPIKELLSLGGENGACWDVAGERQWEGRC